MAIPAEQRLQTTAQSSHLVRDGYSSKPLKAKAALKTENEVDSNMHSKHPCCDACPLCNDTCGNKGCQSCADKLKSPKRDTVDESPLIFPKIRVGAAEKYYTMCEIRRHCDAASCWLIAGDTVYDATPCLKVHPGGATCLLKKAGGVSDCAEDFNFHSSRGKRNWKKYEIGKLRKCGCDSSNGDWWKFW